MAKVQYMDLLRSISGKFCKQDPQGSIFQKRKTCNIVCHIHNPFSGPATAKQEAVKNKFKTTYEQVTTIMADEDQLASYRADFRKQSKYSTLRGYIFATLYKNA